MLPCLVEAAIAAVASPSASRGPTLGEILYALAEITEIKFEIVQTWISLLHVLVM